MKSWCSARKLIFNLTCRRWLTIELSEVAKTELSPAERTREVSGEHVFVAVLISFGPEAPRVVARARCVASRHAELGPLFGRRLVRRHESVVLLFS